MVVAVGRLANGVIVNHLVNWLSPRKERQTIVTGERGALVADTASADLTFYANGTLATQWDAVAAFRGVSEGDAIRYAINKREPLRVEQENFRDTINGTNTPATTAVSMEEGVHTLTVVEAILESAREASAVRV
jgi:predicted dehydrogenase